MAASGPHTTQRPTPWSLPPEGFHFEAVEQGDEWVTPAVGAGRCRFTEQRRSCGKPPVATLFRGSQRRAYDYCAEHLYGRWIEDGKVMGWRLVDDVERSRNDA